MNLLSRVLLRAALLLSVVAIGAAAVEAQRSDSAKRSEKPITLTDARNQIRQAGLDESFVNGDLLYPALAVISRSGEQHFAPELLAAAERFSKIDESDLATFYALKHYWFLVKPEPVSLFVDLVEHYRDNLALAVAAAEVISSYPEIEQGKAVLDALRAVKRGFPERSSRFSKLEYVMALHEVAFDAYSHYLQEYTELEERLDFLRQHGLHLSHPSANRRQERESPVTAWARRELLRLSIQTPARVARKIFNWAEGERERPLGWGKVYGWRQSISEEARKELDWLLPPESEWAAWGLKK